MKKCSKCCEAKPKAGFYGSRSSADGLQSRCRACHRIDQKDRYDADPKVREQTRDASKRWTKANPFRARENWRRRNWAAQGIDPRQAVALLQGHDGKRALCGSDSPRSKTGWHIDHDHSSGKLRGVLCHSCNVGLGHFSDNPTLLLKAADYVGRREAV